MSLRTLFLFEREKEQIDHVLFYLPKREVEWVPTGRIDFAINSDDEDADQPSEFNLLVEEQRIEECIAGNTNLEIQWRLATIEEAKAVVAHYCHLQNLQKEAAEAFGGTSERNKKDAQTHLEGSSHVPRSRKARMDDNWAN